MSPSPEHKLPRLLATSVVRASNQGESHGGIYLLDMNIREVARVVDWNAGKIDFADRGGDRGLRGIAFHDDEIYIAASDELFVFDQSFDIVRSFRNRFLKHCHEIHRMDRLLFLTSTGYDSVLVFDLASQAFTKGLYVAATTAGWVIRPFDPLSVHGPPPQDLLHLNNVHPDVTGLYVSGVRTGGIIRVGQNLETSVVIGLRGGVHNARPYRDGVLFNDTATDHVRYVTRRGDHYAFPIPTFDPAEIESSGIDDERIARQGFGRGLCALDSRRIAAGSSPSTVSVYDLDERERVTMLNISMDIRNTIHGLEVWPYD